MVEYYDPARSTTDRSTAIASLAEIVNGIESAITRFTGRFFLLFVQALSDPEPKVQ
jgi:hypothetical protein